VGQVGYVKGAMCNKINLLDNREPVFTSAFSQAKM
jgi:hypothetical protein